MNKSKNNNTYIIISVVVLLVIGLGVLKFKPWKSDSKNQASTDVIHDGPNKVAKQDLTVGFLPVTCHLTCPVTDYASKTTATGTNFNSQKFSDFPTVVSALEAKQIQASFMLAPLAMKMREDGAPIKICYLGHRDGSEIVVAKNSKAKSLRDLIGKKMAIPSLYSNQNLVLHKLMEDQGVKEGQIEIVVLPPPDMPTSLASGAIDAFFVGEPNCAKAEMSGVGRILYYSKDIWPNFISCVLVVHEDLIKDKPDVVKDLVRGIAESGAWAQTHRADAAKLVAPFYRQDEKLLNFVLTKSPPIVSYTNLAPSDADLQAIQDMALKMGILKKHIPMSEIITRQFIPDHIEEAKIDVTKIPANNK